MCVGVGVGVGAGVGFCKKVVGAAAVCYDFGIGIQSTASIHIVQSLKRSCTLSDSYNTQRVDKIRSHESCDV